MLLFKAICKVDCVSVLSSFIFAVDLTHLEGTITGYGDVVASLQTILPVSNIDETIIA
jgi:hypothetical protein